MPVSTVSIPVGQWLTSAEGTRWWFDSGSFALDFAYTGAMGGNPAWERLHAPDDLTTWLRERLPRRRGRRAVARPLRRDLAARGHRADGRRPPRTASPLRAADIDLVNLYAATPDIPPSLVGGSRQAGRSVQTVGQALSTIARDAVDLFDPANDGRIRACNGGDCAIVYLDTSRAATRRWCSMQRCGNRAKVRAHRARKAVQAAA